MSKKSEGKQKSVVVETTPKITINLQVQSLIEAHLLYDGKVSGRHYEWKRAGEIISVLEEDVPELLSKRLGAKQCCGDQGGNKIFQLVSQG